MLIFWFSNTKNSDIKYNDDGYSIGKGSGVSA